MSFKICPLFFMIFASLIENYAVKMYFAVAIHLSNRLAWAANSCYIALGVKRWL